MNFNPLQHEIDALNFYQELVKTVDDQEIRKEALKLHFDLLKSLHELEMAYRKEHIELDKLLEGNEKELRLARLSRRIESHL